MSQFQLTILFNGRRQAAYLLDEGYVVIGRGRSAHIALDGNPIVSRQHAVVREEGKGHVVEDLGGANGTFVNDQQVKEMTLRLGDEIMLGKHVLRYEAASPDAISLAGARSATRRKSPEDTRSTARMAPLGEADPAPNLAGGSMTTGTRGEPARGNAPWESGQAGLGPAVPVASGFQGEEHTMAASREELQHLLEQQKLKSGPHLSWSREGALQLTPLLSENFRIGWTDACDLKLEGRKLFGRVGARVNNVRAGNRSRWWVHSVSPWWTPIKVNGKAVKKKRELRRGAVIEVGGVKVRFSPGEDQ